MDKEIGKQKFSSLEELRSEEQRLNKNLAEIDSAMHRLNDELGSLLAKLEEVSETSDPEGHARLVEQIKSVHIQRQETKAKRQIISAQMDSLASEGYGRINELMNKESPS